MSFKRPTYEELRRAPLEARLQVGSRAGLHCSVILFFLFAMLVGISSGFRSAAFAEELSADEVQVSTPVYFPSDEHSFREGIFRYEVSWQK